VGTHPAVLHQAALTSLLEGVGTLAKEHSRYFVTLEREEGLLAGTLCQAARAHLASQTCIEVIATLLDYLNVGGHWRLGMELLTLQLAALREVGDRRGEGATLHNLGLLADVLGRKEEAARYYEQALAIQREVGDWSGEGATLHNLCTMAYQQGDLSATVQHLRQALTIFEEIGEVDSALVLRENLAVVELAMGKPSKPARRHWWQHERWPAHPYIAGGAIP
jgi:tetratricopeptide (TPR) repeat protein